MYMHTAWCTPYHHAPNPFVNTSESSSANKSLGRLKTRLDSVNREEEEVDRCSCDATSLA